MTTFEEANSVKPAKFSGSHFQRWKKQMKYWLIALGFISALEERNEKPSSSLAPGQIDYHCYNRILSALSYHLCDVYHNTNSAKDLWNALKAQYGIVDVGIK